QKMKTNHKQTYSCVATFMPLLRHVTTRNLAIAVFVAVALLSTTRGSETEKMAMAKGSTKAAELSQGSLMVCSVMDRFDDDDVVYYEYSSYAIYTINGKLFRHVENRVSSSDQIPEAVTLPAGSTGQIKRLMKCCASGRSAPPPVGYRAEQDDHRLKETPHWKGRLPEAQNRASHRGTV